MYDDKVTILADVPGLRGAPRSALQQLASTWEFKEVDGGYLCREGEPAETLFILADGECDVVSSIGYNPARLPKGYSLDEIDIRLIITNLCVMDFGGPDHQIRLVSLHPGITVEQVQESTGYPVYVEGDVPTTAAPTQAQLDIIATMDPHNQRAYQIKDNPPGVRPPADGS